jgi:hypothetical protein
MRISAVLMAFMTFVAGAAGFYLRSVELRDAFEARTGLPQRGAEITYVLMALCALFLLVAFIFSIRAAVKHMAGNGVENAFVPDAIAYPIVFSVIGAIWFGATVMHYLNLGMTWPLPTTELVFLVLSGLSAISIVLFAVEMYQDPRRKSKFALSIVPSLFICYWLIIIYRQNASNPVLLSYCYQCLAVISSALGFYFTSGFVYNKPAPGKAIFSYLTAVYFCLVTLADQHTISIKIIFIALIAVNTLYVSMLIKNLKWKEVVKEPQ